MIYTAARQIKQKTAGTTVPAVVFYTRIPHPKANWRSTKRCRQNRREGGKAEKTHGYSEQFGNKLFIYK